MVVFAAVLPLADVLYDVPLEIKRAFGQDDRRSAHGDADIHGQMARVAPHDLHDAGALVALHRIREFVDGLDGGVGGGIEPDGVMRAGDVVVDRAGYADRVDAVLGQLTRAAERAVPAYGDDAVDAEVFAVGGRALNALVRAELLAAGGIEDGAAARGDAVDRTRVQFDHVRMNEAVVPAVDTDGDDIVQHASAYRGADRRVHARRVAAAREDADSADLVFHLFNASLILKTRTAGLVISYAFFAPYRGNRRGSLLYS